MAETKAEVTVTQEEDGSASLDGIEIVRNDDGTPLVMTEGQWNRVVKYEGVMFGPWVPLLRPEAAQKSESSSSEVDGGKEADSYKLLPPRGNA